MSIFLSIYGWIITVFSIFLSFLSCLLVYPFVTEKKFSYIFEYIFSRIVIYSMTLPGFWKFEIRDLRKDKSWNQRYIIICNHMSFVDSLCLFFLPIYGIKVMMAEIFTKIPLFGWLCKNSGFIPVDRHNPELCKTAIERAVTSIEKDKSSFLLYPEGLREKKPYVLEKFKTGAYRIAKETGLQILPITLKGTDLALPIGGRAGRAKIVLTINDPFPVEDENYPFYIQKSQDIMLSNF